MKKYISTLAAALLSVALFSSCDKDSEGVTGVTVYAVIELDGPRQIVVEQGSEFVEPGYNATLGGADVSADVIVSTDLDINVPGLYTINYSVSNADGFSTSDSRSVIVSAPGDAISGFYTVNDDSYRDYNGITNYGGYPIIVVGDGSGEYEISDLLGGWYAYRAGYGSAYAMIGQIAVGDDNAISLIDSYVPGWGDSAESLEGSYDADSSTLSWVVVYTEYPFIFHVNATKN